MLRNTALFTALITLFAVGCEQPAPPEYEPPQVWTALPLKQTVPNFAFFTGRTRAKDEARIEARVEGFLKEVRFTDGQMVNEGDVLFIIEQEPYETKLLAAKAELQQAEEKEKLANANVRRTRDLVRKNAVTQEEADLREAELLVARSQIAMDKQKVAQAEIDYNYTIVKSPITGKVGEPLITPGNVVGSVGNTLLTTVVQLDPIYVDFYVPEPVLVDIQRRNKVVTAEQLAELQPPVELGLTDQPGYSHRGVIDFIDNKVDPDTGTVLFRGEFANHDGVLYPGLTARVRIPLEEIENALLVKQSAVGTDLGGKYLLVIGENNEVERRYVTLGVTYGDMQVVSEGLDEQEQYIVQGLLRARPGLPVRPELTEVTPQNVVEEQVQPAPASPAAPEDEKPAAEAAAADSQPEAAAKTRGDAPGKDDSTKQG